MEGAATLHPKKAARPGKRSSTLVQDGIIQPEVEVSGIGDQSDTAVVHQGVRRVIDLHLSIEILIVFLVSVLVCGAILATRRHHLKFVVRRADLGAIQAAHRQPTPRIGGLALLVALLPMGFVIQPELAPRFGLFMLSLGPVFIAGFLEYLGWPVSPRMRLLAAVFSSLICVGLLGVWLPRVDVPGLDTLVQWVPFAILLTLFATAGICNGFNLIDGMNGLAAGVGAIAALAMAAVAARGGALVMVDLNLLLTAALLGFLCFNFPKGRLFLGDAGAYSLGHILAWFAIALMHRVPDLTPWALVLIFFWPIADTFLAIYRRRRGGRSATKPDRLHFHHLVMRAIEITMTGRSARHITNPLSTLILLPMAATPAIAGVWLWDRPLAAFLAFVGFAALFVGTYLLGIRLASQWRRRFLCPDASVLDQSPLMNLAPVRAADRPAR